ncbi:MAG: cation:dicarboxylase symporter family transporter [Bryobacterales bacterium]|nr:cation:dicarboxylase symporter family transporter [Bryobacterales bacterium]
MKRLSLTTWIFIAMAAGVVLGVAAPGVARQLSPLSTIFLRLIRSIIAPLIFSSLVYGIASAGSGQAIGRIGIKALIYFEAATTLALAVGLCFVNIVKPGAGLLLHADAAGPAPGRASLTLSEVLEHSVPASIIDAMAKGEVLQVVIFAVLFGLAAAAMGAKAEPAVELCRAVTGIMFRYTNYVMYLAPLGVGAAIAVTVASKGLPVLFGLGKLVATMYAAQITFVVLVLGGFALACRIPLAKFIRAAREPFLIAFSTASSEAALPRAMENMEEYGVPKHIVALVIPTGYSFNLDGSTLYLSLASVFIAQAAGISLSVGQQVLMMLTLMLTSKGVAGVPRASLVVLSGAVALYGLPLEGVAVLLGIDAVLDMARTSVNVLGNCLATAIVGRWEEARS